MRIAAPITLCSVIVLLSADAFAQWVRASNPYIFMTDNLRSCESRPIDLDATMKKALSSELDPCELANLSRRELRLLRNSIFARHGRAFRDPQLRTFFSQKPWYRVNPHFSEGLLTDLQNSNINLIRKFEELSSVKCEYSDNNDNPNSVGHPCLPRLESFLVSLKKEGDVNQQLKNKIVKSVEKLIKHNSNNDHYRITYSQPDVYYTLNRRLIIAEHHVTEMKYINDNGEEEYVPIMGINCSADIFSPAGRYIISTTCPHNALKDNSHILLSVINTGCCGPTGWLIIFDDIKKKTIQKYRCGCEACIDTLLTYLPDSKHILLITLMKCLLGNGKCYQIYVLNTRNEILAKGVVETHLLMNKYENENSRDNYDYDIRSITGVKEIKKDKLWIFRYGRGKEARYLLLDSTIKNKEKYKVFVTSYPKKAQISMNGRPMGVTPKVLILGPGEYKYKISLDGYKPEEGKLVYRKIMTNEIYAILDRSTNKLSHWQETLMTNVFGEKRDESIEKILYVNNNIHTVMRKYNECNSMNEYTYMRYENGNWLSYKIEKMKGILLRPAMAVDYLGNIHLVGVRRKIVPGSANIGIEIVYYTNKSGKWSSEIVEYINPGKKYYIDNITQMTRAQIAIDERDVVHISYPTIKTIRYATKEGGKWKKMDIANKKYGTVEAIYSEPDNVPRIIFCEGKLIIKKPDQYGAWNSTEIDTCRARYEGNSVRMEVDKKKKYHIVYIDENCILKYASDSSGQWRITEIEKIVYPDNWPGVNRCVPPLDVVLDENDNISIVYISKKRIRYASKRSGHMEIYELDRKLKYSKVVGNLFLGKDNEGRDKIIVVERTGNIIRLEAPR